MGDHRLYFNNWGDNLALSLVIVWRASANRSAGVTAAPRFYRPAVPMF